MNDTVLSSLQCLCDIFINFCFIHVLAYMGPYTFTSIHANFFFNSDMHIDDTPPPASSLSMPQLNSTAQLCNKIHQLKHHNRNQQGSSVYFEPTPSEMNITSNRKLPTPAQLSAIKENVADLAGLLNHRPLKVSFMLHV